MDTSKIFKTMCFKAKEIQAVVSCKNNFVWEPTQDQFQMMLGELNVFEIIDKFHTFCMWDEQFETARENLTNISMEKLWLAFVMKEKYNKIWNGKDWIVQ